MNQSLENLFYKLSKSKFRSSFKSKEKDIEYIKLKGIDIIKLHAQDFIKNRLSSKFILNNILK